MSFLSVEICELCFSVMISYAMHPSELTLLRINIHLSRYLRNCTVVRLPLAVLCELQNGQVET